MYVLMWTTTKDANNNGSKGQLQDGISFLNSNVNT